MIARESGAAHAAAPDFGRHHSQRERSGSGQAYRPPCLGLPITSRAEVSGTAGSGRTGGGAGPVSGRSPEPWHRSRERARSVADLGIPPCPSGRWVGGPSRRVPSELGRGRVAWPGLPFEGLCDRDPGVRALARTNRRDTGRRVRPRYGAARRPLSRNPLPWRNGRSPSPPLRIPLPITGRQRSPSRRTAPESRRRGADASVRTEGSCGTRDRLGPVSLRVPLRFGSDALGWNVGHLGTDRSARGSCGNPRFPVGRRTLSPRLASAPPAARGPEPSRECSSEIASRRRSTWRPGPALSPEWWRPRGIRGSCGPIGTATPDRADSGRTPWREVGSEGDRRTSPMPAPFGVRARPGQGASGPRPIRTAVGPRFTPAPRPRRS